MNKYPEAASVVQQVYKVFSDSENMEAVDFVEIRHKAMTGEDTAG
jgi:hypothetical protein